MIDIPLNVRPTTEAAKHETIIFTAYAALACIGLINADALTDDDWCSHMTLFITSREKFLRRFESHGDGFAYRETSSSRAIYVSAEEREWLIAEFLKHDDATWVMLGTAIFLAVVVTICAIQVEYLHTYGMAIFWSILIVAVIGLDWFSRRQRRAFERGRVFIDLGLPQVEVDRRERNNTSWGRILWIFIFNIVYIKGLLVSEKCTMRVFLMISAGAAVAYNAWIAYLKIKDRFDQSRRNEAI